MTAGGAVFMALSWAAIVGLNLFCIVRLRRAGAALDEPEAAAD